jgi:hypothetical protein
MRANFAKAFSRGCGLSSVPGSPFSQSSTISSPRRRRAAAVGDHSLAGPPTLYAEAMPVVGTVFLLTLMLDAELFGKRRNVLGGRLATVPATGRFLDFLGAHFGS